MMIGTWVAALDETVLPSTTFTTAFVEAEAKIDGRVLVPEATDPGAVFVPVAAADAPEAPEPPLDAPVT